MTVIRFSLCLLAGAALLSISACAVGPDYKKPDAPAPAAFKEQAGWKQAEPADAVDRGPWWSVYNDPALDELEKRVDVSNQTLKAAEAAYFQSRAAVDAARAGFLPSISGDASATRSRALGAIKNSFNLSGSATWDLDFWGRIRRTVEGDIATAQASAADLALARLSAQATLAIDYFELRTQEDLKRLLDTSVVEFQQSLRIAQNQYDAGVAAKADVLSAQTELLNTQAQAINSGVLRATLEHAIAVLVGEAPASFTLPPGKLASEVPVAPAGLPASLLERRPDIAAAERKVAAASAGIGVAIAAYFPNLTLSGSGGSTSSKLGSLFTAPTLLWSAGASLADTIFDAGSRSAQVEEARAAYDQAVANYRQTVLAGFQQVEDELSTLRILEAQAAVESQTVKTAQEAARLTLNQYKAGTVPYSSVITAQTTALSAEQTALTVLENRLTASVTLIEALGGGWTAAKLPQTDQVEDNASFLHVVPIRNEHPTSSGAE